MPPNVFFVGNFIISDQKRCDFVSFIIITMYHDFIFYDSFISFVEYDDSWSTHISCFFYKY